MPIESTPTLFTQITDFFWGGIQQLSLFLTPDMLIRAFILYFFVIWGAFIIWVTKDITNRTTNILYQIIGILTIILLTPILGLPIYLLIRPRNTLVEQYYEENELDTPGDDSTKRCPYCEEIIESDFFFCPHCHAELLYDCFGCEKIIQTQWKICPYCGIDQTNEELRSKKSFAKKVAAESKGKKISLTKTLLHEEDNESIKPVEKTDPIKEIEESLDNTEKKESE